MNKLYINYIPKIEGEHPDFKIVKVIKKCMQYYNGENNIISSPGYLSGLNTVKNFVAEFATIVPSNNHIFIGYFSGMNGMAINSGITNIDAHYNELVNTKKFSKLNINAKNKRDHRKMLFFYGIKNDPKFNFEKEVLSIATEKGFLDSIKVKAVLIGSSNQNYTTYYGGSKNRAHQGEADVLLFTAENPDELEKSMFVEGTVIFEELLRGGDDGPETYLKNILKDFLDNALY